MRSSATQSSEPAKSCLIFSSIANCFRVRILSRNLPPGAYPVVQPSSTCESSTRVPFRAPSEKRILSLSRPLRAYPVAHPSTVPRRTQVRFVSFCVGLSTRARSSATQSPASWAGVVSLLPFQGSFSNTTVKVRILSQSFLLRVYPVAQYPPIS